MNIRYQSENYSGSSTLLSLPSNSVLPSNAFPSIHTVLLSASTSPVALPPAPIMPLVSLYPPSLVFFRLCPLLLRFRRHRAHTQSTASNVAPTPTPTPMPMFLLPLPPLFAGGAVAPTPAEVVEADALLSTVFVDPSLDEVKVAVAEPETPITVMVVAASSAKIAALTLDAAVFALQHATELSLLGEQQNWSEGHAITLFHVDGRTIST
jgi:hypothetical protein